VSDTTVGLDGEFSTVSLGDKRLDERLLHIIGALAAEPTASFPRALASEAALEAGYRFFANEDVSPADILAPHVSGTAQRCADVGRVIVVHDTTQFQFSGDVEREGLGRMRSAGQGFFAHFSIGISEDESIRPLGTLSLETIVRPPQRKGKRSPAKTRNDPSNESLRWLRGVERCERALDARCQTVHVMDREGDSYDLFSEMLRVKRDFVVRVAHDRAIGEIVDGRLSDALVDAAAVLQREVPVASRKAAPTPRSRRIHPARDGRIAKLSFRARAVTLLRPKHSLKTQVETVPLNIVHVVELEPPPDSPAIEWKLLTSLPISSADDVARVVDIYRARWRIEEFFKALKTGCAFEKRQLESLQSLLNALAVFVPIAWRLLLLRATARSSRASAPAPLVMPQSRVDALVALANSRGAKLPASPSVQEALLGVARIGGHIKNNGDPGWIVLGRGYEKLLMFEAGWLAAKNEM
jgi:Transposase DNA-binding/Transposase DDE domain